MNSNGVGGRCYRKNKRFTKKNYFTVHYDICFVIEIDFQIDWWHILPNELKISVQKSIKLRTSTVCGKYFATLMMLKEHTMQLYGKEIITTEIHPKRLDWGKLKQITTKIKIFIYFSGASKIGRTGRYVSKITKNAERHL